MGADVLTAHFVVANGAQRLDVVKGSGRTTLEQVSETGVVETSQGDALEARFPQRGVVVRYAKARLAALDLQGARRLRRQCSRGMS